MKKNINICLAASEGGHLEEIQQIEKIFKLHRHFFVTEQTLLTLALAQRSNVHFLKHINRRKWSMPFLFIYNTAKSYQILMREKPDLVISTGALSTIPICVLAKLTGSKLIFIETYSRVSSVTLTGRFLYRLCDLFIIQREELKKFYPKAIIAGAIF
jgi:beta-1,4-N-acetylglucosaminyltransferase